MFPYRASCDVQDFDTAKRHIGMVMTQFDPDNEAASALFKSIKEYQRMVTKLRKVRAASCC